MYTKQIEIMKEAAMKYDIVRYKGGIGNQMFQYAFQLSLEEQHRNVFASDGYYRNHIMSHRHFNLQEIFPNVHLQFIDDEKFNRINEQWQKIKNDEKKYDAFISDVKNRFFWVEENESQYVSEVYDTTACAFVGYWQTEKYFINIKKKVNEKFQFNVQNKDVKSFVNECRNSIGVHVRLGDYLNTPELYGGICTREYYQAAIRLLTKKTHINKILVFSDDVKTALDLLSLDESDIKCFFLEPTKNYKDWYDMYLMSNCKHMVIANSSFSWWGAWLNNENNRIIVAPQRWLNGRECPDICPNEWIRL